MTISRIDGVSRQESADGQVTHPAATTVGSNQFDRYDGTATCRPGGDFHASVLPPIFAWGSAEKTATPGQQSAEDEVSKKFKRHRDGSVTLMQATEIGGLIFPANSVVRFLPGFIYPAMPEWSIEQMKVSTVQLAGPMTINGITATPNSVVGYYETDLKLLLLYDQTIINGMVFGPMTDVEFDENGQITSIWFEEGGILMKIWLNEDGTFRDTEAQ